MDASPCGPSDSSDTSPEVSSGRRGPQACSAARGSAVAFRRGTASSEGVTPRSSKSSTSAGPYATAVAVGGRLARSARGCNIPSHEAADLGNPPGDRRARVRRVRLCPMAQQPAVRSRPPGLRPPRCELRALHVGKGLAARLRSPVESQPELAPPPAPAELAQPTASLESLPSAAQSAPTQRHAATRPCQLPPIASFRAGQVSRDRDVDGGPIARGMGVNASLALCR